MTPHFHIDAHNIFFKFC